MARRLLRAVLAGSKAAAGTARAASQSTQQRSMVMSLGCRDLPNPVTPWGDNDWIAPLTPQTAPTQRSISSIPLALP